MDYQFNIAGEYENAAGLRIDSFLSSELKISRTKIQSLIKSEKLRINGVVTAKTNRILALEDSIEFDYSPPEIKPVLPENFEVDIIFEDEHLIILNKDAGVLTHPAGEMKSGSLVNALMYRGAINAEDYKTEMDEYEYRPGVVHRLDKDTSGLIMFAKTPEMQTELSHIFKRRLIEKKYLALVCGMINEEKGIITYPIGRNKTNRKIMQIRDDGKPAITEFKTIFKNKKYSLLEVNLKTGRTHQIRTHFKSIHHPVAGDKLYSSPAKNILRLMLHSYSVKFVHPVLKTEIFKIAPIKKDFAEFLKDNDIPLKNYEFEK
ncbi:MAG TPA: RluA family pseudouridine synthase [bacterium]|nr:RluA family pseudouridine synthase [bacterium]HPN30999.1 RluA family pseudouridine synthase [bacterium]